MHYQGGAHLVRAPPKIGKNMIFFGVKSWFFTWNTPKISRAPPKIGKIWFFGVKSWFFTRNTQKIFVPPSARCNFFKLKSWICPWLSIGIISRPIRLNAILYWYNVCLNLHKDRYSIYLERFSVANSGFLSFYFCTFTYN